jgi:hypothetical protein
MYYKLRNYELLFLILTEHFYSDKIKKDEMGGACDVWKEREMSRACRWETLKNR